MSYRLEMLFVKPNSEVDKDRINPHFVNYVNYIQPQYKEFIIGKLFNSRDGGEKYFFSDKTKKAHGMTVSVIDPSEVQGSKDSHILEEISNNFDSFKQNFVTKNELEKNVEKFLAHYLDSISDNQKDILKNQGVIGSLKNIIFPNNTNVSNLVSKQYLEQVKQEIIDSVLQDTDTSHSQGAVEYSFNTERYDNSVSKLNGLISEYENKINEIDTIQRDIEELKQSHSSGGSNAQDNVSHETPINFEMP